MSIIYLCSWQQPCALTRARKHLAPLTAFFPQPLFFYLSAALIFDGTTNPAHPDTIGCIDSLCDVPEVIRGEPEQKNTNRTSGLIECLCYYSKRCAYPHVPDLLFSTDAYESAKMLCEQYYLGAPELEMREINGKMLHKSKFRLGLRQTLIYSQTSLIEASVFPCFL